MAVFSSLAAHWNRLENFKNTDAWGAPEILIYWSGV